jgi:hypothetical protein
MDKLEDSKTLDLNYREISENVYQIENSLSQLMDKMLVILEKRTDQSQLTKKGYQLIAKTQQLVNEIKNRKNILYFEEKEKELKQIQKQIDTIMDELVECTLIENQKKISSEFEAIIERLNKIKQLTNLLSIPHLYDRQKKPMQQELISTLKVAKQRVYLLDELINKKKNVNLPNLYYDLKAISQTISDIEKIRKEIEQEEIKKRVYSQASLRKKEIETFFIKEMEGKIYIDKKIILLESKLTGRKEEYSLDSISKATLNLLFDDKKFLEAITELEKSNLAIVGKFRCFNENSILGVEFELIKRKITFDMIVAKPIKLRIFV